MSSMKNKGSQTKTCTFTCRSSGEFIQQQENEHTEPLSELNEPENEAANDKLSDANESVTDKEVDRQKQSEEEQEETDQSGKTDSETQRDFAQGW